MRQIKFRAWDEDTKEMKRVLSVEWLDNVYVTYWNSNVSKSPAILMQFTGLLDKNGKEIYEGDILDLVIKTMRPVVICWNEKTAAFACRNIDSEYPYSDHLYGIELGNVIGNVFSNPELLKQTV